MQIADLLYLETLKEQPRWMEFKERKEKGRHQRTISGDINKKERENESKQQRKRESRKETAGEDAAVFSPPSSTSGQEDDHYDIDDDIADDVDADER